MPHVLKFGVVAEASREERDLLAIADKYRLARYSSHLNEHRENIDFRNRHFPKLYSAMVDWERAKASCLRIEKEIKKHHSDQRDRNAVRPDQDKELRAWRKAAAAAHKVVRSERTHWYGFQRAFREAFRVAADWKNVKDIEKRRDLYRDLEWGSLAQLARRTAAEAIANEKDSDKQERMIKRFDATDWNAAPALLSEYADIFLRRDMERRELSREYQDLGLGSGTRGEIDAATKPKLNQTGPGTRYRYHQSSLPKPWKKLTQQFAGGILVRDAMGGRSPKLRLTSHPRKNSLVATLQFGTKKFPVFVKCVFRAHKPLLPSDVIQRVSLVIDQRPDDTDDGYWKRSLHFTVARSLPPKAKGVDILNVRLRWTRRKAGIEVAEFVSPTANERLILPDWLIRRRVLLQYVQMKCDSEANAMLTERGVDTGTLKPSGVAALEEYQSTHEDNHIAAAQVTFRRRIRRARLIETWTIRTIETIYHTVASRMASVHSAVRIKELDLQEIKRYDSRDLLREDRLPPASRTILHAVAPGKLKAYLRTALPVANASGKVAADSPGVARESDIFTTYVLSLGPRGGRWSRCGSSRSQSASQALTVQGV